MLRVDRQIAELQPRHLVAQDEVAHVSDDGPASHLSSSFNRESKSHLVFARKTVPVFEIRVENFRSARMALSRVTGSLMGVGALFIDGSLPRRGALSFAGSLLIPGALAFDGSLVWFGVLVDLRLALLEWCSSSGMARSISLVLSHLMARSRFLVSLCLDGSLNNVGALSWHGFIRLAPIA
jgi:hypothetical protein